MVSSKQWLDVFDGIVLKQAKFVLVGITLLTGWWGWQARHFRLDASAETLLLENDPDLRYARAIHQRYGDADFLIVAYRPHGDLFSDEVLTDLNRLHTELTDLDGVASVLSLVNVPLLESPPVALKDLSPDLPSLTSTGVNRELARRELSASPLYQDLLVSPDLKVTGLLVNLEPDAQVEELLDQRQALWDLRDTGILLSPQQRDQLEQITLELNRGRDLQRRQQAKIVEDVRDVMAGYCQQADLVLGGVSMIAHDMIRFIRRDLKVFGSGVVLLMMLMLGFLFRRWRWVLLPLLICTVSVVWMVGLLGLLRWEVTVISTNFISLQLILTLSLVIHLIVRYRELRYQQIDQAHRERILETIRTVFRPSLFCSLTTIAGFASLVLCDIRPVIAFGWMMVYGIVISQVLAFVLFPAVVMLLSEEAVPSRLLHWSLPVSDWTRRLTECHGRAVVVVSLLVFTLSALGLTRLQVENAFINYFHRSTEIHRGMALIDRSLGGTTSLDVIIDMSAVSSSVTTASPPAPNEQTPEDVILDANVADLMAEYEQDQDSAKSWFTPGKMERIRSIQQILERPEETGKVMSLATALALAERLTQGRRLDALELNLMFNQAPERLKSVLIDPYVSVEHDQVRFWLRIRDSLPGLRRQSFLQKLQLDLLQRTDLQPGQVHLTGLMVLYNNMLQSLFRSQILTLGLTLLALTAMFGILFRSLRLALIALVPNLLPITVMLGVMGWFRIPLDMMTITIAAISVGIAVDDTIHYIHRFRHEFGLRPDYLHAMQTCHNSVGHAMTYTSVTIILGFAILSLSNFIPTVAFGLLTGLVMLVAMVTAQTLLPQLIVMVRPFTANKP